MQANNAKQKEATEQRGGPQKQMSALLVRAEYVLASCFRGKHKLLTSHSFSQFCIDLRFNVDIIQRRSVCQNLTVVIFATR